ncbi:MAG TPA: M48 family metallopeptidase [Opitutaceae bacterium]
MSTPASPTAPALFALEGSIPPRKIPAAYRFTLGLTAFALVLLPLAYLALIAAAGYGVYLWAIKGTVIFSGSGGGWIKLLVYLAPLFAGAVLVAFMIKPLFARSAKRTAPYTLDLAKYPELRDLIAAICARVGAPMPVRVDLDCQVNASASLRRGLLSLGRRDLVLTIGLPLVQGLTTRQLAGVLAHEFGHFAQGAGMAFTYVIRSINHWFARVVFERDEWDQKLEESAEGADFRIQLVIQTARGGVWLSRKILHGLMLLGHVITCLQLRQMEYDADYYETQLVGSDDFAATGREIARLAAAGQVAFNELGSLWRTRQLVDDFSALVVAKRAGFNPAQLAQLEEQDLGGKTGWLDTHPSNRDRIAAAQRLALKGILRCDVPAAAFFRDLPELARTVTRHFYREQLELTFDDSALVATAAAQDVSKNTEVSNRARERLVGTVLDLTRPLVWRETDFAPPPELTPDSLAAALADKRAELDRLRKAAEQDVTTYGSILEHALLVEQGHALISASVKVVPKVFHLAKSDLSEATQERSAQQQRLAAKAADLRPFESAFHAWIALVGQAARAEGVAPQLPAEARDDILRLTRALAALAPWFEQFPAWHRQQVALSAFFANHKGISENKEAMQVFQGRFNDAAATGEAAIALVGDAPYPLAGSSGTTTAAAILRGALEGVEGAARLNAVLDTVASTYFRLVSHLASRGEALEKPAVTQEQTSAVPAPAPAVTA